MARFYQYKDGVDFSLLRKYHSLLELRLLELANARFVWKGKNSFSFNRCFLVLEGGGRMTNHSGYVPSCTVGFNPADRSLSCDRILPTSCLRKRKYRMIFSRGSAC